MKILSSLVKRMKREKIACYVPALSFGEHRVTRGERHAEIARLDEDFAHAYLARVRRVLGSERKEAESAPLARRAAAFETFAGAGDELDEMIESLSLLAGLNVSERAYYACPRRK